MVNSTKQTSWLKITLGILLGLICLYYVSRDLEWKLVQDAFKQANFLYLGISVASICVTLFVKVLRWRLLFYPNEQETPLSQFFFPTMAGQLLNLLPLRIGDLGRMFMLSQSRSLAKTHVLGTIAVEKSIDLIMFAFSLLVLLPFAVFPDIVSINPTTTILIAFVAFIALFLMVFQSDNLLKIAEWATSFLPQGLAQKLLNIIRSGLESAKGLRNRRVALLVFGISIIIPFLHVLTPYLMFRVFNLPLTFIDAAVINFALTIVSTLPGTPGNLGVFEAVVVATLEFFGVQDNNVALAYGILFHLVVLFPQLVFGTWALIQADLGKIDWQWRPSVPQ